LRYFKAARVKISEYEIPQISNVQKELTCRIREDVKLTKLGTEAYHAYLAAYAANSREYGDIYDVRAMDLEKVACCFGFDKVPSSRVGNNSNNNNADVSNNDEKMVVNKEANNSMASLVQDHMKTSKKEQAAASKTTSWKPKKYEKQSWMTRERKSNNKNNNNNDDNKNDEKMVVNKEANINMPSSVQDHMKTTKKEQAAAAAKTTTWKPKKHEKQSWMTRDKKSWKYANVHAKTMGKGSEMSDGKNEFNHNMPKTIKLRNRSGC